MGEGWTIGGQQRSMPVHTSAAAGGRAAKGGGRCTGVGWAYQRSVCGDRGRDSNLAGKAIQHASSSTCLILRNGEIALAPGSHKTFYRAHYGCAIT